VLKSPTAAAKIMWSESQQWIFCVIFNYNPLNYFYFLFQVSQDSNQLYKNCLVSAVHVFPLQTPKFVWFHHSKKLPQPFKGEKFTKTVQLNQGSGHLIIIFTTSLGKYQVH